MISQKQKDIKIRKIQKEDIEKIPLMPPEIKEKFVEDIRKNKI